MASPKTSNFIILLFSIVLLSTTTSVLAFNITRILDQHPDFSTFNDLLTQTGVASAINGRSTITVLVVANAAMGPITSRPISVSKNILATHVILDYISKDVTKLGQFTLLFQASGKADQMQGHINVSKTTGGDIIFGSAVKGAPRDSKLVSQVVAQPYNISVVQISQPLITPGLDQAVSGPTASAPVATPPPVAAPPPKKGNAPTPASAEGPTADDSQGPAAADSPVSDDESGSPGPAPASGPAPGPAPDADAADEPPAKLAPGKSGGARVGVGCAAFMGLISLLAL